KKNFRPDSSIDKQLEQIALKLDVKEVVFQAMALPRDNKSNTELAGQILAFYAGIAEVKNLLDNHVKSAKSDDLAYAKGKEKADAANVKDGENAALAGRPDPLRYAILVQAPTDTDKGAEFGAKIVELGPPYCGDKISSSGKCDGESPSAYAYRTEPGATWTKGDIASQGADSVPTKRIILLLPGGVRDGVIKGGEPTASEVLYAKRMKTIYELVHGKTGPDGKPAGGLLEDGNRLETRLQTEAAKGTQFSFFM
ncbi:MAG: hypothetical protein JWO36_2585, partial [Myxococcales bacterium]|nr:hypothetical protein [Myxococcales bacterium]